jgi:hypothetical protein
VAGVPVKEVDGEWLSGMSGRKILCLKIKRRAADPGVERHPETVCPLDPEPGLGGILSLGLLWGKARLFFCKVPYP